MSSQSVTRKGTYREADGAPVEFADALRVWTRIAYERLIEVAHHYNGLITDQELSEHVQSESGIRTTSNAPTVAGKLLELCAAQAAAAGEPPLTSLCLRRDGTVGPAYWRTPTAEGLDLPDVAQTPDVEQHAAEHRLLCYRKYSADMPSDGGRARLPEALVLRREREDRKAARSRTADEDAVRPVCPGCFTQLPASGVCWQCD